MLPTVANSLRVFSLLAGMALLPPAPGEPARPATAVRASIPARPTEAAPPALSKGCLAETL
ncbi:MAG TPA: hypothetical protein VGF45_11650, partial [Polyangia bacterium]